MHKLTRRAALGALASISATGAAGAALAASSAPEAVDTLPSPPAAARASGWLGDGVYQLDYPRAPKLFIVRLDERPYSSTQWVAFAETLDPDDITHFMPMAAFHHRNPVKVGEIGRLVDEREDPLVAAIAALHVGMDAFDREAPDDDEGRDAVAAETYEPPLEALLAWDRPATSRVGAIAALRVVGQVEWLPGGLKLALAMNTAALRYLARYELATEAQS